jgi:Phage shock protein A (IM30), suppresses sigma54-dependent transcription
MDKLIREFPVTVYGNLTKYSETISKARCRIFYRGANRNGTYITDEFAEKLLSTISYSPVKGIFEESENDFTDHGTERSLGRIYGVVPESPNFAWETFLDEDGVEREYACVDVLLYTSLYKEAQDIPGKSQSMELYAPSIKGNWEIVEGKKLFKYTDGCFLGLQVLGDTVEPCFEGAAFFTLYEAFVRMTKELEKFGYTLSKDREEGGLLEMKVNFKLSDAQKHDGLFSLLNEQYNEENGWMITYAICDVYDEYAVCYNYEAQQFERVYYTKDDATDSLTLGDRIRCYIVDVTEKEKIALEALQALNGGNFELVDEKYAKIAEYEQKIEELDSSVSTLEQEKGELSSLLEETQATLTSVEEENASLNSYKKEIETAEKMRVIDSYANLLAEDILDSFKEKVDEYTAIELDKELAYSLKQNNFSAFQKEEFQVIPKDNPLTGIEAILSKYKK